jgi:hypothetical protein
MGFRARLAQSPPLVGARSIALVQVTGARAADLENAAAVTRFPSATGAGDLEDIAAQADQILAKVNQIPIEEIGQNLRAITSRLGVPSFLLPKVTVEVRAISRWFLIHQA